MAKCLKECRHQLAPRKIASAAKKYEVKAHGEEGGLWIAQVM
jgi:hypothetical protein